MLLHIFFRALVCAVFCTKALASSESWQTGYTGTDATGSHVLGYWQFKPGQTGRDASGKGHDLALAGALGAEEGRFDGALESFSSFPPQDKRHAAFTQSSPELSPKGAFTLEMWIKPKQGIEARLSPVLMDKKYVSHNDYQWRLTSAAKDGARRLQLILGFGADSETYASDPFFPGEEWQHVAATYDGAGEVHFFRNGASLGGDKRNGRAGVTGGKHILSIADRVGSSYSGFPGFVDEVRICAGVLEMRPAAIEFVTVRKAWLRMEKAAPVTIRVRNQGKTSLPSGKLVMVLTGVSRVEHPLPALAGGAAYEVVYLCDTTLRPDTYKLKARIELQGDAPYASEETMEWTLAPRPLERMPVTMWGIGSPAEVLKEMPRLQDLGFTHCLGGGADVEAVWKTGQPAPLVDPVRISSAMGMLDTALARGFRIAFTAGPGHFLQERPELQRIDRQGNPYKREAANAALGGKLEEYCFNVGASIAQTYGNHPAWEASLVSSEVRDSAEPSFSEFDKQLYRSYSGGDIPASVQTKYGVLWNTLKEFPADHIVPDDHPILSYYRWYWSVGDGWNALHTATHRGLHSGGRKDVWTWFDPAIRAASVGGSGGGVDVLSQWTYTNPDPIRLGYFTDQLLAMAANSAHAPKVMKMTQLFWYRSQTAPNKPHTAHTPSPFDDHDPDAAYITISPVHLREAFWTKIARPIQGIMYHGWQALVPTPESGAAYRYTHPETRNELRRLLRGVLEPLGPALLQVPDYKTDVAYLDSFSSQVFARRGSYGYSHDETYLTLLHAQLQPRVVYDEEVLTKGLGGFKVLVLANCDVLTDGVAKRVRRHRRGGRESGAGNHPRHPPRKSCANQKGRFRQGRTSCQRCGTAVGAG